MKLTLHARQQQSIRSRHRAASCWARRADVAKARGDQVTAQEYLWYAYSQRQWAARQQQALTHA